jgi:GNAT superfamily N-acetyltransferase
MSRKVVPLTLDLLRALPGPCRSCVFWELDPVRRGRVADPAVEKAAWIEEVLEEWGSCGRVMLVDDVPVGHVVYAPAAYVPGAAGFPTAPVSADAVLLTTVYVDPAATGGGLGRMLVQGMARDLVERGNGIRAVEAFADTRRPGVLRPPGAACTVPVGFLDAVGFATHRAHGTTPRMRMELRTTLTWKTEMEAALERLVGAVRPVRKPAKVAGPKATRGPAVKPARRPSAAPPRAGQAM